MLTRQLELVPRNGRYGILPAVDRGGGPETVKVIREEHEWRGLSIVEGGIPREFEAEEVVKDGGYELINEVLFSCCGCERCSGEHDSTTQVTCKLRRSVKQLII